jgi:hypothetical protein
LDPDLEILIDPSIEEDKVAGILEALATYYRACGGVGFDLRIEQASEERGMVAGV